jgi:hypothetical protein
MENPDLKRSRRTVIFLPVYKISSLKITLSKTLQLKTLDFLQQTITMNENAQWQMIKDFLSFIYLSNPQLAYDWSRDLNYLQYKQYVSSK